MKKRVRCSDGSLYSPAQILDAANSYYALSSVLTDPLPDNLKGREHLISSLGAVTASATNRLLALELYLKGVLVAYKLPVPWEHDLVLLFEALPPQAREPITFHYNERMQSALKEELTWSTTVAFQRGIRLRDDHIQRAQGEKRKDPRLPALLERNRNGFTASRYIFEKVISSQADFFEYEYRQLGLLCGIIREGLENAFQNNFIRLSKNGEL